MSKPQSRRGFSVNVFLPTGDPEGLKVVEKSNWSGRGLVVPRAIFGDSKMRVELDCTGVYVLIGPGEASALPTVYVGEGDPVRPRLREHASKKDFWTHAVVFTSKDSNLNKAHVQWLEYRLVELAKQAKRCALDNGNEPKPPSLSEADEAMAEGFLDDVLLCLPLLGYSVFEAGVDAVAHDADTTLYLSGKGIEGRGQETASGFVVFKGSKAVGNNEINDSILKRFAYVKNLRDDLIQQNVMQAVGQEFVFTQDYPFTAPSTAAMVLLGRVVNGRTDWKTKSGRTLKEIQDAEATA